MRTLQEMTLQEKLGQRLAAGFQGLEPPKEFLRLIKEYKVGNIILFRRNIQDGPQLKKLCATLRKVVEEETGVTPFITIDQEGGVVTRLPESEVNIPGAMAVAATGNPRNAYDMGLLTAQELRSCGVDFNLAPVMDINCNPDNPVIGVRSYGDTPERVAEYGSQMVRGLLDGGVYCSLKHFPGHGDTAEDSHTALAVTYKTLDELQACELLPFEAAAEVGPRAVMVGHIVVPELTGDLPATLCADAIALVPDAENTLIVTDSLAMGAITDSYTPGEAAVQALQAGCDVLLMPDGLADAYDAVLAAVQNGTLSEDRLDLSVNKILRMKAQFCA